MESFDRDGGLLRDLGVVLGDSLLVFLAYVAGMKTAPGQYAVVLVMLRNSNESWNSVEGHCSSRTEVWDDAGLLSLLSSFLEDPSDFCCSTQLNTSFFSFARLLSSFAIVSRWTWCGLIPKRSPATEIVVCSKGCL